MLVKGQWRRRILTAPQGMSEDEMEKELKEIMLSFNNTPKPQNPKCVISK